MIQLKCVFYPGWQNGLGSVLNIPQDIISNVTRLISMGALLWDKSAVLTGTLLMVILANRRLSAAVYRWVVGMLLCIVVASRRRKSEGESESR